MLRASAWKLFCDCANVGRERPTRAQLLLGGRSPQQTRSREPPEYQCMFRATKIAKTFDTGGCS